MTKTVIQVDNLSKRYRIGRQQVQYDSLREHLANAAAAPFRRFRRDNSGESNGQPEHIWALKDVSFEVNQGEVVGIIGRNGAGKTTLLKILSRITRPTKGKVRLWGRVGSLLEVGTGFHPELTGRENIYLNGAVLGMQRAEIKEKFDEIVDFAEIEKFLDTPVKRYSSGMYVRLAFAVAAHLEPEILMVDEVLAVGDIEFQKKCLGKIGEVAKEGRTVLFISHNMEAIKRLCNFGYLIDKGEVLATGAISNVVDKYYNLAFPRDNISVFMKRNQIGIAGFLEWKVKAQSIKDPYTCFSQEACRFEFRIGVNRRIFQSDFGIAIWTENEHLIWAMRSTDYGGKRETLNKGQYQIEFYLPEFPIRPGLYQIQGSVNSLEEGQLDVWYAQPSLRVLPKHESGIPEKWQGYLNLRGEFTIRNVDDLI